MDVPSHLWNECLGLALGKDTLVRNGWVDDMGEEEYQISYAGIIWKERRTWLIRLW
jgi:hypothetical protein